MLNKWFKNIKRVDNCKLRMFCFPHAGGAAQIFNKWECYLPDDVELYAVQLPGRADRINEPLCSNFDIIINNLTESIFPLLNPPFIFIGHSFGGAIAFEIAKKLRRLNIKLPERLFIIGREGPSIPENIPKYNLPDDEFIKYLRSQSGIHEDILEDKDAMHFFLPILRNDIKLADTYYLYYTREAPLSCPINVFYGEKETDLDLNSVGDWKNETINSFNVDQFDGHHFFLHEQTDKVIKKMFSYINLEISEYGNKHTSFLTNTFNSINNTKVSIQHEIT
ncbi:MAG TPA: putative thioesterase [Lentisphaeria bacterium]|nr:MAG: hypothetical protein A2X47_13990 [Lentisphaerae bacterium GWF2_38_69]HBM16657.1 putative thioesterase [Lentisphaeria bacterium]